LSAKRELRAHTAINLNFMAQRDGSVQVYPAGAPDKTLPKAYPRFKRRMGVPPWISPLRLLVQRTRRLAARLAVHRRHERDYEAGIAPSVVVPDLPPPFVHSLWVHPEETYSQSRD